MSHRARSIKASSGCNPSSADHRAGSPARSSARLVALLCNLGRYQLRQPPLAELLQRFKSGAAIRSKLSISDYLCLHRAGRDGGIGRGIDGAAIAHFDFVLKHERENSTISFY